MMIFLISDYHTGKTLSKQFQLCFPVHHKKLVKLNENQSITKKFSTIFREKVTKECCDLDETLVYTKDCLHDTTQTISKIVGVKFRISPGNINYSKFPPGSTNYVLQIREVENSNFFQRGVVLQTRFFRGALRGEFSRGNETGCYIDNKFRAPGWYLLFTNEPLFLQLQRFLSSQIPYLFTKR